MPPSTRSPTCGSACRCCKECIARAGSLEAGLRYYVGAANLADDGGYAGKVLTEQGHLRRVAERQERAADRATRPAPIARAAARAAPGGPTDAARRRPAAAVRRPPPTQVALLALARGPRLRYTGGPAQLAIGPLARRRPEVVTTGKRGRAVRRGRRSAVRLGSPRILRVAASAPGDTSHLKRTATCSTAPIHHRQTSTPRSGPPSEENQRQEEHIELIASENYASPAVMAAQGTQLTNKYAEGYPGKRYYGGCEYVDIAEQLAIDRLKQLFGAEHSPTCSRTPARRPTRRCSSALLKPGDTIMGMSLAEGGHLTHGMALNMSGKWFKVVSYGLNAAKRSTTTRWSGWRTSTSRS